MDIKETLTEIAKEGTGDAIIQYPFYKFVGDKLSSRLHMLGKYADVGAAVIYAVGVDYLSDSVGGEFSDYMRHGAASVVGRTLSVAMGDPSLTPASNRSAPQEPSYSGTSRYSSLNPVPLPG